MRHTFTTPWGRFAIQWSDLGITRVELPPAQAGEIGTPPPEIRKAAQAIQEHLAGRTVRLDLRVDLGGVSNFERRIFEVLRETCPGETLSYADLASRAGRPGAARAVGNALRKNPVPVLVPCHRVLAAGGKIGGFSAPGGTDTKRRLLSLEGWKGEERGVRRGRGVE
ncbi:MAG: methylated-DNA-protein-cysteine [Planctomycetota bacterium]|nr:MAG: methylated-DNA-protein-cysteine [Planctomycetota bacterium]